MRHVSLAVDGFEVEVGALPRAADRALVAARELEGALRAVRALALTPADVGPRGAALSTAVAAFAARAGDRLAATARGLDSDGAALRTTAETYVGADRWFAHQLDLLR